MVLVRDPALAADEALWADCQERAREVAGDTPVCLIAHTVDDVRQQLARGSSFFRDVMTEGVALYDACRVSIAVPELTPAQRLELAQAAVTRYFEHAAELYRSFERNLAHGSHAIAAFELHQVAETIYKAVLLVFTAYQPKLHDLDELGRRCARVAPDIGPLVPLDALDRERLAALLRAAYVDARYSFTFHISREDLEALAQYVERVQVAHGTCVPGAASRASPRQRARWLAGIPERRHWSVCGAQRPRGRPHPCLSPWAMAAQAPARGPRGAIGGAAVSCSRCAIRG